MTTQTADLATSGADLSAILEHCDPGPDAQAPAQPEPESTALARLRSSVDGWKAASAAAEAACGDGTGTYPGLAAKSAAWADMVAADAARLLAEIGGAS